MAQPIVQPIENVATAAWQQVKDYVPGAIVKAVETHEIPTVKEVVSDITATAAKDQIRESLEDDSRSPTEKAADRVADFRKSYL